MLQDLRLDELLVLIEGVLDVLVSHLSAFNLHLYLVLQKVSLSFQKLSSRLLLLVHDTLVIYGFIDQSVELFQFLELVVIYPTKHRVKVIFKLSQLLKVSYVHVDV